MRSIYPFEPFIKINHSCEPNGMVKGDELFAIRDIAHNEEITFDYSTTMLEDKEKIESIFGKGIWELPCNCGSATCRKRITPFYDIPLTLQKRYLELDILPEFIIEKILENEQLTNNLYIVAN